MSVTVTGGLPRVYAPPLTLSQVIRQIQAFTVNTDICNDFRHLNYSFRTTLRNLLGTLQLSYVIFESLTIFPLCS